MKFLIIDNEPQTGRAMEDTLQEEYGYDHCVARVSTVQKSINILLKEDFDVVLFKLKLKGGTCFDILDKVQNKTFKSIFITDNPKEDELINAVKYAVHDFLHIPVSSVALLECVESAIQKINEEDELEKMSLLVSIEELNDKSKETITFQLVNGSSKDIFIKDILFLEADGAITYLHLLNNIKHSLPKNIGCYKDFLAEDFHFKSISKSILINLGHLKSYNHNKLEISLQNGLTLTASRRGGKDFREYLHNFQPDDMAIVLNRD